MEVSGKTYTLLPEMFSVQRSQRLVSNECISPVVVPAPEDVIPSVVESSFDMWHITYAVLEHAFRTDRKRAWLALPPAIAPVSCSVLTKSDSTFKERMSKLSSLCSTLLSKAVILC